MVQEIIVFNSDEFEKLILNRDIRISKALVSTVLKNLKGRKRHLHALSVFVEQEQTIYDITIDRKEFAHTLKENLSIHEDNELFEVCAEIMIALKDLDKN